MKHETYNELLVKIGKDDLNLEQLQVLKIIVDLKIKVMR